MEFDIVSIGSATRDIFVIPDEMMYIDNKKDIAKKKLIAFEYGAKISTEYIKSHIGGTAVNVAVGLTRLGLAAAPMCSIGEDDAGQGILEKLKKETVSSMLIDIKEKSRTDQSVIMLDKLTRERTIFVYKDAGKAFNPDFSLATTKGIFVSSLRGNWEANLEQIREFAASKQVRLFFNPGLFQIQAGIESLKNFLASVEAVFLNDDEAIELTGKKFESDIPKMAAHIASLGPKIVVITEGEKGAHVFREGEMQSSPINKVSAKDVTGAGDAFVSGFLAAYLKEKPIEEAIKWGINNSSSVVTHVGTLKGLLTLNEIENA